MKPIIRGTRVILREWDDFTLEQNAFLLLKWFTDPEVMKYVGFFKKTIGFRTVEEIKSFISFLPDAKYFGLHTKDNGIIGVIELSNFVNESCEFGIFIGKKEFWAKGFGTEATRLICQYAFQKLNVMKINLTVASKNIAGQKAYARTGFIEIDRIANERVIFENEMFVPDDTIKMELIRDERNI